MITSGGEDLDRTVRALFADAGCAGWLHAVSMSPAGRDVGLGADTPVVMASVYKLPLVISLCRMADRGAIDLTEAVVVTPGLWSAGATGLGALRDPVRMTWRDLATSMVTVSDNVAADVILDRVGLERVQADLAHLGLRHTRIVGGMAELHARLQAETGTSTVAEAFAVLGDSDVDDAVSAYDAAYSSASTPRDCTTLLTGLWRDEVASPESCAFIRDTMRAQVFTSRLASGFPFRHVTVAGKTGTLAAIRNEVGVVEFPDEHPVAVAVFTKSARSDLSLPDVDRTIGRAARAVVTELRVPVD
ncbi:serine hydrolase [Gordonia sp. OPL2]|uniref:serine hydrolase n=1 Tax=Gordonia sp. OPL2 TaxID=2486274 RepID=UPI0021CCA5B8|nr:serine hydrolase [Gordonia sp. OPL2]